MYTNNVTYLIVRRASWGTGGHRVSIIIEESLKYDDASLLSGIMELPHTLWIGNPANLSWFLFRKFVGFFWCVKESCIPSLVAKKYKYLLFSTKSLSRGVTLIYLRHSSIEVCHHSTLLTHLITFLGSYYSVNFILNPIPARNYFKNLLFYTTIYERNAI